MRYRGFVGGTYESQAFTAAQMRLVNFFVERMEDPGSTTQFALLPTPGVETIATLESAGGRAHIFVDGREFLVSATSLIEVDTDGTPTFRGLVAIDTNPATISSNGDGGGELFITSGGNGYVYDLATHAFTQITNLNGKATMGDQLDGYFLALDANTGTFYSSELLDGLTWTTGTMFAQRNAAPDPWIAFKVKGRFIHLKGANTSEAWFDAGSSPFPFEPHPSGGTEYGIAAPFSLKKCDDSLLWLGSTEEGRRSILRSSGFAPEVVSTYAVDYALSQYETVSDAYADSYTEGNHAFYVLSFPTADATWVYDLQMQQWHERGAWDGAEYSMWRPRCHAFAFGEHRWLDATSGAIYRMSSELGFDAGGLVIRRLRRAPCLMTENERVFFSAFEVDLEPGLGLVTGQGSDPQVMLRMSPDGGKTWGAERWRSAGKIGEYQKRVRWERCGAARRRVFEIVVSDPTPFRITGAYLTLAQPSGAAQDERRSA